MIHSYVDALFYSIDGNFRQSLRNKPMDKNDVPMTEGAAYFSSNKDFKKYLNKMGKPEVEVRTSERRRRWNKANMYFRHHRVTNSERWGTRDTRDRFRASSLWRVVTW